MLRRFLRITALTTGLAAAQNTSIGGFVVLSAVAHDIPPAQAGLLLAAGSVICAACRLAVGAAADRGIGGSMRMVSIMLAAGAVGLLAMAHHARLTFVIGCLLAFGGAWGFPGLVHYVVGRVAGSATTRATATVQAGTSAGATVGPVIFGLVLHHAGQTVAWGSAAGVAAVAAALALWAHRTERALIGASRPGSARDTRSR
ncbi:MFS transporter [Blastococcus brunescens]|uniref:MFS transporter n=1 Tax=Blastococcus brunescens TaxID=1564165 RepID=A0ABZ1AYB7_9ACTN|nr:MFS transporter [Blastococcus sp. BMG 8361]WRL63566.1 MFS transporter [Blastococcus sp. BMG 8361]